MNPNDAEQAMPKKGSRKGQRRQLPWRRDPVILARLPLVERRHLSGQTNAAIATALAVDEATIRRDIERLRELWLEKTKESQDAMRAAIVAELNDTRQRALHQADWDEYCERAVLFDDPELPDADTAKIGLDPERRVHRDDKGGASFRSTKAQSLNVARQATMDKAKVLGLVVDKQEIGGGNNLPPIRFVEVVPPDGGDAAPDSQD